MALGFYFQPKVPMSAQVYNECIKLLKKAGAGNPPGRLYHACFGSPDNLAVFDIWTSQAAFEKFGRTLMPIMQQLGADPGQPVVMPIHNVMVPPKATKAAKKPAVKKAASKKPVAAKKKTTARRR